MLVLAGVGGCITPVDRTGGWTGSNGDPIAGCQKDSQCGGDVCARDGSCQLATDVRVVHAVQGPDRVPRGRLADGHPRRRPEHDAPRQRVHPAGPAAERHHDRERRQTEEHYV